MKIALLKDVKKVGKKGDIVEVAEGYGRNFLIKNGFAKLAVGGSLKQVENTKKIKEQKKEEEIQKELEILGQKNKKNFTIQKKSDNGHLFAKISAKEISEISGVDEKNIIIENEIKSLGDFEIKISLGGKKGKIFLKVENL